MTTRFKFLTGDVNWPDYGGKFYRRVAKGEGPTWGRFHVMEVLNWNEHDSNPECTYNVDLSEVDLDEATAKMIDEALRSCYGEADAISVEADPNAALIKVECLHSYGSKAPLWNRSGNNLRKLMAECRAESAALDDPSAHEAAMSRAVNAIGSTAREFAQGDIYSAMDRGVREGDEKAKLMAKLYGADSETIEAVKDTGPLVGVAFSIKIRGGPSAVPSDDPLAYAMGYIHAMAGQGLEQNRNELADEYKRGYRLGVDVKAGRSTRPGWAR